VHHSISQIKHQLDATLCRFYFCGVTLHVSGASAHHQEYLKLVQQPLVRVLSLQVSHHISLLGPKGPNKEMWWLTYNDNTRTSGRCTSFKYSWWWALAPETCRVTAEIKPAQRCIKLVFYLSYTVSLVLKFKSDDDSPEMKYVAKTSNQYMKVVVLTELYL
jgi:uncharacterized protein (UPF0276 family)